MTPLNGLWLEMEALALSSARNSQLLRHWLPSHLSLIHWPPSSPPPPRWFLPFQPPHHHHHQDGPFLYFPGGGLCPCLRLQAENAEFGPSDCKLWTGPTPKNFIACWAINKCIYCYSIYSPESFWLNFIFCDMRFGQMTEKNWANIVTNFLTCKLMKT